MPLRLGGDRDQAGQLADVHRVDQAGRGACTPERDTERARFEERFRGQAGVAGKKSLRLER